MNCNSDVVIAGGYAGTPDQDGEGTSKATEVNRWLPDLLDGLRVASRGRRLSGAETLDGGRGRSNMGSGGEEQWKINVGTTVASAESRTTVHNRYNLAHHYITIATSDCNERLHLAPPVLLVSVAPTPESGACPSQ